MTLWLSAGYLLRSFALALSLVLALAGPALAATHAASPLGSLAFYYGDGRIPSEFQAFDAVVIEPDHGFMPAEWKHPHPDLFAYVSVGEIRGSRAYAARVPDSWRLGFNPNWGSIVIDQSQAAWPEFFADNVVAPLWKSGFRGVFLDALDSYHHADRPVERAAQVQGMVRLIKTLRLRFPELRIILNRGFELLPDVHHDVTAVVAESLYRAWDSVGRRYTQVAETDRAWLLDQLRDVRNRYSLPVVVIDYVSPGERALARETAERIRHQGFIPWVVPSGLKAVGVGPVEVMPRRVMVLFDSREVPAGVNYSEGHRFLEMPLNYLGYVVEHLDIRKQALPVDSLGDRYAGVVTWFNGGIEGRESQVSRWLLKHVREGLPVAALGQLAFSREGSSLSTLGLERPEIALKGRLKVIGKPGLMGFEVAPEPDRSLLTPTRVTAGKPLLELEDDGGNRVVGAALMPWGGFVLSPFAVVGVPGTDQSRWVLDPFAFLKAALRLPEMPVPDPTTENGRRLFVTHIDGDGFPSRAEIPGNPYAGEALLSEVLERYRLPTAVSVIEAETSPDGLHPDASARTEAAARKIFSLPHVEIASHTYSHPFRWAHAGHEGDPGIESIRPYGLAVPGYRIDPTREILGSVDYVRRRLAPEGKPVQLFFWSGDAAPDAESIQLATDAGLLNLNGGMTAITRANPTLTAVHPLGIAKGRAFQVYAPVTNENIYTGLWTGPYYGFERVIETWQMTESPRRLKPVGLYYHAYSATKAASLAALRTAYDWALKQSLHPVFASEYARKVLDFNEMVIARGPSGWVIRSTGHLRTVRFPVTLGTPDAGQSRQVAGFAPLGDSYLAHLTGPSAILHLGKPLRMPTLAYANARLTEWSNKPDHASLTFSGYVPIEFSLRDALGCEVTARGLGALRASRNEGNVQHFRLPNASAKVEISCRGA